LLAAHRGGKKKKDREKSTLLGAGKGSGIGGGLE